MKKRILLACNYFAPENVIAAVRISKLAKYFKSYGYEVSVLTEKKDCPIAVDETLLPDAEGIEVIYAENSKACKAFCKWYAKMIKPAKDKRMTRLDNRERVNPKTGRVEFYPFQTAYPIIGSLDYLVGQLRQMDLARQSVQKVDVNNYDFLITSYGDASACFIGKALNKRNKNIPWIFDIRDAIYGYKFVPDYVSWIPKSYEKYIWKHADAIVGISKGICNRVPEKYRHKAVCITNGFEKETDIVIEEKDASRKMIFTYAGSMYGGLRDLSEFFRAIRILAEERAIDLERIEFRYAGNASAYEIFKSQAQKYDLDNYCAYRGKVTRKESIGLQYNSDILLMASYDYQTNNGGVITGKLLEYMASERPVVAIVTGDIINSEVSQIIAKTNIGICCEASGGENDFCKLKEYIRKQYERYEKGEAMIYEPNRNEVDKFDYKNLTKRYRDLLLELEERGSKV